MRLSSLPAAFFALTLCVALNAPAADAAQHRSQKAKREFKAQNPCPATGKPKGACPGYVIDHVIPLCAGGKDSPGNMQWQTVSAAKLKDKQERKQCRRTW